MEGKMQGMAMGEGEWDTESHWLPQESAKMWEERWTIVSHKYLMGDGRAGLKEKKWFNSCPVPGVKGFPTPRGFLSPQEIEGASHHVYADQPHIFNAMVEEICDSVD